MKKVILFFVLSLICIPLILLEVKKLYISPSTNHIVLSLSHISPTKPLVSPTVIDTHIPQAVAKGIGNRKGEYGIYYKNLVSGEVYEKNSHEVFYAASLYKLWVMAELFQQIDEGTLKKEEVLGRTIPQLNTEFDIASEEAELTEGSISLTVDDALENMITVSSNYAAYLLADRLGTKNIASFLKTNGFVDSSFGSPPKTSPHDIGEYFDRLYHKQLVAPIYTKEMIAILSRQQLNDRIPKYLPEKIEVAHKTGELAGYKHDGGIVFDAKDDYILVVMSKSLDEAYAAETIALIAKEIYAVKHPQEDL